MSTISAWCSGSSSTPGATFARRHRRGHRIDPGHRVVAGRPADHGRAGLRTATGDVPEGRRPAVPLIAASGTLAAVGMEVNVDYLGVRVVDLSGDGVAQHVESADFRGSDPVEVMGRLSELYCEVTGPLGAEIRMAGSCLAVPGLVDRPIGPVRLAPNLGWRDVDVVERVPFASGDRATYRSGWTTRPPSAPGRRPTRSARRPAVRSSTCPVRSASVAHWSSTARCSADGTAGAARSATPWSIRPVRCAAAAHSAAWSSTPARTR